MSKVKLESSDGIVQEVDYSVIKCSKTIKMMLDNLGFEEGVDEDKIPLPNVKWSVLEKVIEWATHHKDDVSPEHEEIDQHGVKRTIIKPWDMEFLKVDQSMLFELILAANYLDIKGLLDIGCMAVADMIAGKTPEEIRKQFNIAYDFTQEEYDAILRENEWCQELGEEEVPEGVNIYQLVTSIGPLNSRG